ncbi:MAG: Gfo/Idh/MocA family oxidoreductase [Planctomycetia bacterium]|nr:MAG: Gfo/Idh/MocA family oxidoreductase [Planctomycetia bacterium]
MSTGETIGVGVIGLGFIGSAHLAAYRRGARDGFGCEVRAVYDPRLLDSKGAADIAVTGNLESQRGDADADPAGVRHCSSLNDLLDDPAISLVSICTPTATHVEVACRALRAGKHVLVEKPLCLRAADAEPLLREAAARPDRIVMPGFCMRFWPGWDTLLEFIRNGSLGPVHSAVFGRLGSRPTWSETYADDALTGGALVDLHTHDADFVRACFGDPASVMSGGSLDHVTTIYRFSNGPAHVVAEGAWDHRGGWPFRMRFVVAFDEATAEFDSGRDEQLRISRGGKTVPIKLEPRSGWENEIRALMAVLAGRRPRSDLPALHDAHAVATLLERERESVQTGRSVRFEPPRPLNP